MVYKNYNHIVILQHDFVSKLDKLYEKTVSFIRSPKTLSRLQLPPKELEILLIMATGKVRFTTIEPLWPRYTSRRHYAFRWGRRNFTNIKSFDDIRGP